MKHDDFGTRMKDLEKVWTSVKFPKDQWICVRIDGKGFSKFTKDLKKPFDNRLTLAMQFTALDLLDNTPAHIAYTQSDEISLFFAPPETEAGEHWFDGKLSKINSITASMTTAFFAKQFESEKPAFFDARSWATDQSEASNVLLWRMQDARKNSVASCYRWVLGKKKMPEQFKMLEELELTANFIWEDLPISSRYGSLFKKIPVTSYNEEYEAEVVRTQTSQNMAAHFNVMCYEHRVNFMEKLHARP